MVSSQSSLRWLLLLCALRTVLSSLHGHCVGTMCVFHSPLDFGGAKDACRDLVGRLFTLRTGEDAKLLPSAVSGRFWIQSTNGTGEDGAPGCPSASLKTAVDPEVLWGPCSDTLDGFLCQYKSDEVCEPLQTSGEQVRYATVTGIEMSDSETLPPGTTATTGQSDALHPDSKHLCFSTSWLRAPWNCEVLSGGCEYKCDRQTGTCVCPSGQPLHQNGVSCVTSPCAQCAHRCQSEGDTLVCACESGYRLEPDGKRCADVNECREGEPCAAQQGAECVNTEGGYECTCAEGFDMDEGVCVNVTICRFCEHMKCLKFDGVFRCVCRDGFVVSPKDPTKCEQKCVERDCPASCITNTGGSNVCFCPDGYVLDEDICTDINECEGQMACDHQCENLFGTHRCLCEEGFDLEDGSKCVPVPPEDKEEGSASEEHTASPPVTPAGLQPAPLPSFVKTGSILGITVFVVLCTVLMVFIIRNAFRRCGRFELSTFKHPELDIYYLQQVTTETYKRLSFDRQQRNECHKL